MRLRNYSSVVLSLSLSALSSLGNMVAICNTQFSSLELFVPSSIQKDARNGFPTSFHRESIKNFLLLILFHSFGFALFHPFHLLFYTTPLPFCRHFLGLHFLTISLSHHSILSLRLLLLPKLRPLIIRTAFKASELSKQERIRE